MAEQKTTRPKTLQFNVAREERERRRYRCIASGWMWNWRLWGAMHWNGLENIYSIISHWHRVCVCAPAIERNGTINIYLSIFVIVVFQTEHELKRNKWHCTHTWHKWAANSLKWWMKLWANRDGKRTEKENASLFDWQMTIDDAHNADNSQCRLTISQHPEAEPNDIFNRCSLHFFGPHRVSFAHHVPWNQLRIWRLTAAKCSLQLDSDYLFVFRAFFSFCFHFQFSFRLRRNVCASFVKRAKTTSDAKYDASYRCHCEIDKQFTRNCHLVIHKLKRRKSSNNNNASEFENACVWANHTSLMAFHSFSVSRSLIRLRIHLHQATGVWNFKRSLCVCVSEVETWRSRMFFHWVLLIFLVVVVVGVLVTAFYSLKMCTRSLSISLTLSLGRYNWMLMMAMDWRVCIVLTKSFFGLLLSLSRSLFLRLLFIQ